MDNLITQSIQSDIGKEYGKSTLEHRITYDFLDRELAPLIEAIHGESNMFLSFYKSKLSLSVADWGGGNGILAKHFLAMYKKTFFNPAIDITAFVIDADKEKLGIKKIKSSPTIPTFADIRNYKIDDEFDYSMMRNVMHYMNDEGCIKTLKNVYDSTKKGFLFINHACDDRFLKGWHTFEQELLNSKPYSILRYYRTEKEIQSLLSQAGFATSNFSGNKNSVVPTTSFKDESFTFGGFDYYAFYEERCGKDKMKRMPEDTQLWLKKLSEYRTLVYYFEKYKLNK